MQIKICQETPHRDPATMPIETVAPSRLYRQVADQLLALIEKGEFPAGSRLPTERDLAVQFGVSRPTVREALIALEVHGRINIRVGSGIYVRPPMEAQDPIATQASGPFEILEARALFEGAVAEEAARKAVQADITALNALLRDMETSLGDHTHILTLDRAFHTAIAGITGNSVVAGVVGELFDQRMTPYFAQLAGYFENVETWRAAYGEHRAIVERIAAGDAAGARAAMQIHLANSQRRFTESFREEAACDAAGRPVGRSSRRMAAG